MKDNKIELLLNNIYSQVDLKEGVFDYVQPFITKAYALLRSDTLNEENGKSENILFRDMDSKNELENILYRDLPGTVDIYTKMPLDYRNERIIKNGKTHRQLLIENITILTNKLKEIEHNAYEQFDTHVKVSNRFIKERYDSNFVNLTEAENEIEIKDNFSWFNYKQDNVVDKQSMSLPNYAKDDNRKIVLQENGIEYKVKDHHRHFMAGVYDAYANFSRKVKTIAADIDLATYKTRKHFKRNAGAYFISLVVLGGLSSPIFYNIYANSLEKPAKDMEEIGKIINGSENFRDLTIKALDKFAKENQIVLQYTPDKDAVYAYKEMNKTQCVHSIEYMQHYDFNHLSLQYYMNERLIDPSKTVNNKIVSDVCDLPKNTMTFGTFKLK